MMQAIGKSFKYWILVLALVGFTFAVYSQDHPPEPQMAQNGNGRGPCGELPDKSTGGGPSIPPPVGLCLPINDYLLPLLISGIAFGGIMMWRLERSTTHSVH